MRLLIVTQAVDTEDPVLGFFVRWIEEFAMQTISVEVICLKKGKYTLPENVHVHSLGKEYDRPILGSVTYALRFLRLTFSLRREYDAVFVHMNPEYVVLGAPLWRLSDKYIALWYTHKSVDLKLRVATFLANILFTASPESFRLSTKKLQVMGHGIDTDFFTPDPSISRGDWWLSVGRLMPSKRHDLAIREAAKAGRSLRIAGTGSERLPLETLAREVGAKVSFLGPLSAIELRSEYRRAARLIHRSETGSLDKVVLEAAACGLSVDTTDPALARLPLSPDYVREHHSLVRLISAILILFPRMSQKSVANTRDVQTWWNAHPFAFGISNTARDQVGTIPLEMMDLAYFDAIENQFRKHHRHAAQDDDAPLFSNIVNLDSLRGKKVLDIAIGSGFSAVAFARAGAEVTGIDLTAFAVQHAKKNLSLRGLHATIEQMDAQAMAFPDASFDFVNAWGCLMHMPDTEKAVQEIYRVLKPGGKMLAYMYNKASWPYWFNYFFLRGVLMGDLIRYRFDTVKLTSRHSDGYSVGGNPRAQFFNPREVDEMLMRAGFSQHRVEPWRLTYEPDHWPLRTLPIFRYLPVVVKRRMTRFGYGLIVFAEK